MIGQRQTHTSEGFEIAETSGFFRVAKIDSALAITKRLTASQLRSWLYLMMSDPFADRTDDGLPIYHSIPTPVEVAQKIGASVDTVEKDLRTLRKLGLYDYRIAGIQGYNCSAEHADLESLRLKQKQTSSKAFPHKDSAYLSGEGAKLGGTTACLSEPRAKLSPKSAYLSQERGSEPLPDNDFGVPQTIQTYSDFKQTLSEEQRASFLNFCEEKTLSLNQPINDLEAWLAHQNKAGQNRWEVYYEKFQNQNRPKVKKSPNNAIAQQFASELAQQKESAQASLKNEARTVPQPLKKDDEIVHPPELTEPTEIIFGNIAAPETQPSPRATVRSPEIIKSDRTPKNETQQQNTAVPTNEIGFLKNVEVSNKPQENATFSRNFAEQLEEQRLRAIASLKNEEKRIESIAELPAKVNSEIQPQEIAIAPSVVSDLPNVENLDEAQNITVLPSDDDPHVTENESGELPASEIQDELEEPAIALEEEEVAITDKEPQLEERSPSETIHPSLGQQPPSQEDSATPTIDPPPSENLSFEFMAEWLRRQL